MNFPKNDAPFRKLSQFSAARIALLSALARMGEMRQGPVGEFEFAGAPMWDELSKWAVVQPDQVEAVRQPLYDTLLYPTAGQLRMPFFQLPQGQGVSVQQGNAGNTKSIVDTNMESAGQLPSPKAFLATSVEVIMDPGSISTAAQWSPQQVSSPAAPVVTSASIGQIIAANALNDINAVMLSGALDFFIISKSYLTNARLDSFPPKSHVAYDGSISGGGTLSVLAAGCAGRAVGRPFYVNPPVLLLPNTNFTVSLNWPALVPTPSGFNARIMIRLDGFLYRNAQ